MNTSAVARARLLGFSLFLIFLSYYSAQFLAVAFDGDVGAHSLPLFFVLSAISSLFLSAPVVRRFGPKNALFVSCFFYVATVASHALMASTVRVVLVFVTTALIQVIVAVLWTSIGTFLTEMAEGDSVRMGKLSANFYTVFLSNLTLPSLVLLVAAKTKLSPTSLFLILTGIGVVGASLVLAVPKPPTEPRIWEPTCRLVTSAPRHVLNPAAAYMIPLFLFIGLTQSFVSEALPNIISTPESMVAIDVAVGVATPLGALTPLVVASLSPPRRYLLIAAIVSLDVGMMMTWSTNCYVPFCPEQVLYGFFCGYGTGLLLSVVTAALGCQHRHNSEAAFALQRFFTISATAIGHRVQRHLDNRNLALCLTMYSIFVAVVMLYGDKEILSLDHAVPAASDTEGVALVQRESDNGSDDSAITL
jgi:hypothetical protein